ncbi:MAG: alpha/beta fold hydrolase [Anaerolineae bacterium]
MTEGSGTRHRRLRAALLITLICATSCRSVGTNEPPTVEIQGTPTITPVTDTGAPGTFEAGPCAFVLPDGYEQGVQLECGYLIVAERRDLPDPSEVRKLRLAVAIFHPASGTAEAEPVIYLSGGPGASALEPLRYGMPQPFEAVLASGRDLIVFDQRGVGRSRPALDCPEVDALSRELLDRQIAGEQIDREEALDMVVDGFLACGERLSETADLTAYNSAASASDVDDLRRALGYAEVILWGGSYGTRLALEVMRQHPEGIHSVVLDSVYPPDVDLYATAATNFERSLDRLFESCAENAVCGSRYPDLQATFLETVARLNAQPVDSTVIDVTSGEEVPALVDGDLLVAMVFQLLYSTEAKLLIPELIDDASRDDFAALENLRSSLIANQSSSSRGMTFSVQCNEEIAFSDRERGAGGEMRYPELAGVFAHGLLGELAYRVCEGWDAGQADPSADEAVVSDIPTLVMTGEFDPITPPAWGRHVVETLSHGYAFEYPGVGHGASAVEGCPQGMLLAFLDDPTKASDAACIAETSP